MSTKLIGTNRNSAETILAVKRANQFIRLEDALKNLTELGVSLTGRKDYLVRAHLNIWILGGGLRLGVNVGAETFILACEVRSLANSGTSPLNGLLENTGELLGGALAVGYYTADIEGYIKNATEGTAFQLTGAGYTQSSLGMYVLYGSYLELTTL